MLTGQSKGHLFWNHIPHPEEFLSQRVVSPAAPLPCSQFKRCHSVGVNSLSSRALRVISTVGDELKSWEGGGDGGWEEMEWGDDFQQERWAHTALNSPLQPWPEYKSRLEIEYVAMEEGVGSCCHYRCDSLAPCHPSQGKVNYRGNMEYVLFSSPNINGLTPRSQLGLLTVPV